MAIRTINGLRFTVTSPSFWELTGYPIELNYLGDGWFLTIAHKEPVQIRPLASFAQGIELIATAFGRR